MTACPRPAAGPLPSRFLAWDPDDDDWKKGSASARKRARRNPRVNPEYVQAGEAIGETRRLCSRHARDAHNLSLILLAVGLRTTVTEARQQWKERGKQQNKQYTQHWAWRLIHWSHWPSSSKRAPRSRWSCCARDLGVPRAEWPKFARPEARDAKGDAVSTFINNYVKSVFVPSKPPKLVNVLPCQGEGGAPPPPRRARDPAEEGTGRSGRRRSSGAHDTPPKAATVVRGCPNQFACTSKTSSRTGTNSSVS